MSSDVGCLRQWHLSKTPLHAHALQNFLMSDLFVLKGGHQNKNYHFWFGGTISGRSRFLHFVPGKKRGYAHMPCTIFTYMAFLCHEEVAKTKIIIFGAGEPHQATSEFSSLCRQKNAFCAHCLAQFSRLWTFCVTRWSPKQKWAFLVQGNHIRQFPNFLVCTGENAFLCALPCTIFVCKIFLYHGVVAKTKIIIFGAGEPYQAISEFFRKTPDFYKFFGKDNPFFVELPQ